MRNVFSYCFRKPSRAGVREEEIESEATIYLVLKGLPGFREAEFLLHTPPHADPSFTGEVMSLPLDVSGGIAFCGLERNPGSAQGPLVIVAACGGFTSPSLPL